MQVSRKWLRDASCVSRGSGALQRGISSVVRTAILLVDVLDVPGLRALERSLTSEPRSESLALDDVSVEVIRPGGRGPWPAWVFVNGAHPLRRREPVVRRLADGLSRAGYLVVVPDLPGLGEGEITQRTLDATCAVAMTAADMMDVRDGRVALCGASAGASLALLAAQHRPLADRITVVAAITPWADLEKILFLATTGHYEEHGQLVQYPVTTLLRRVVARSIVAGLTPGEDRDALLAKLRTIDEDVDPTIALAALRDIQLRPGTQAAVDVLLNSDPDRFAELHAALPEEVCSLLRTLSPLARASELRAPVEIVRPPVDQYFPLREARDLEDALPQARLTVTRTLDHTRPSLSLDLLADFVRFNGFVTRGLAAALS